MSDPSYPPPTTPIRGAKQNSPQASSRKADPPSSETHRQANLHSAPDGFPGLHSRLQSPPPTFYPEGSTNPEHIPLTRFAFCAGLPMSGTRCSACGFLGHRSTGCTVAAPARATQPHSHKTQARDIAAAAAAGHSPIPWCFAPLWDLIIETLGHECRTETPPANNPGLTHPSKAPGTEMVLYNMVAEELGRDLWESMLPPSEGLSFVRLSAHPEAVDFHLVLQAAHNFGLALSVSQVRERAERWARTFNLALLYPPDSQQPLSTVWSQDTWEALRGIEVEETLQR